MEKQGALLKVAGTCNCTHGEHSQVTECEAGGHRERDHLVEGKKGAPSWQKRVSAEPLGGNGIMTIGVWRKMCWENGTA